MIYPNGFIDLNHLKKMVGNPHYDVYVEETKEPKDWDWKKYGIFRGHREKINTLGELENALPRILENEDYTLCYDLTDAYYKENPYPEQEVLYVKPCFVYKQSGDVNIEIKETVTRDYERKSEEVTTLEILQYSGDFNSTCWVIAEWTYDSEEGYEFRSIGSRLFGLSEKDLDKLMTAIREGDKYLRRLFESN